MARRSRSSSVLPIAAVAILAVLGLVGIAVSVPTEPRIELDSIEGMEHSAVQALDSEMDSAVLGQKASPSVSEDLAESHKSDSNNPFIPTALDVVNSPGFKKDVRDYRNKRHDKSLNVADSEDMDITPLERKQAQLKKRLNALLKKQVKKTTAKVSTILSQQDHLQTENADDIEHDLSTNLIRGKPKPFRSDLAKKDAREDINVAPHMQQMAQWSDSLNTPEDDSMRTLAQDGASLAAAPAPAGKAAAAPKGKAAAAPKGKAAAAGAKSAGAVTPKPKRWAWDSVPPDHHVAYDAMDGDDPRTGDGPGYPAAWDTLQTGRRRVVGRLRSRLRHAQHRLDLYRRHWRYQTHDVLDKVVGRDRGWDAAKARDFMNAGRVKWDLIDENKEIKSLGRDLRDKMDSERDASEKLQDVEGKARALKLKIADLKSAEAQYASPLCFVLKQG
mmetsp:Transcript_4261/g.9269  ORF Transcript_4261/g.9269 Transcript_4261/m.9269 type:complete len:444 (-) Transcript_4261:213-1544(-)